MAQLLVVRPLDHAMPLKPSDLIVGSMKATEPSSQTASPAAPSKWKLAFQSYVALIAAAVLGVLASAPVIYSQARFYNEITYVLGARPADDSQLRLWGLSQPRVVAFKAERRGPDLWVRSEYESLSQQPPLVRVAEQMRQLGYEFRGIRGGSTGMASGLRELLADPMALAVMLAGMQVAFAFIGLNRIRAAARCGEALPPLFATHHARAVAVGALGGLFLIGLGMLNSQVLKALFGHEPPSPWDASTAMSGSAKLVFLVFGGLGAPIAEEIFFRGYVFGKFRLAGFVWFGSVVSAVLFGVVHFSDSYNVPCICLFGVFLAWLYHRTGSLLAPITAHAVNNGTAILTMILS